VKSVTIKNIFIIFFDCGGHKIAPSMLLVIFSWVYFITDHKKLNAFNQYILWTSAIAFIEKIVYHCQMKQQNTFQFNFIQIDRTGIVII
jgi:hypothetical protein